MTATIRVAAAVVVDETGRLLLVRKRGTSAFMLPGGKIAPSEDAAQAMTRELAEEIGCGVAQAQPLGRFLAPAANEPEHSVDATLFRVTLRGAPVPAAEIDALLWCDPASPGDIILAPLIVRHVLPLARTLAAR